MPKLKRLQIDVKEELFKEMKQYISKVNESGNLIYNYRIKHLVVEALMSFLSFKK